VSSAARGAAGLCLLLASACQSQAEALRTDAFVHLERGDMTGALDDVRRCSRAEDDQERFLCASSLGELEIISGDFRAAALAFGDAFAVRDRIAASKHYGTPDATSLYEWAYADVQIGHLQEASGALVRGKSSATEDGDNHILRAAMLLLEAEIAQRNGDAKKASELQNDASTDACSVNELKYFDKGDGKRLPARYLPTLVWLDVGDACSSTGSSEAATMLYVRALGQALLRRELQLVARARAKPGVASVITP
jgi:hypothetical protein